MMVFFRRTAILGYLAIFILMSGCSGQGGQTPNLPDTNAPDLTADSQVSSSGNTTYIWGTGEVTIDMEDGTAKVTPLRTVDFTLNIVKFLQPPAGNPANLSVLLDVPNCDFPNAYIELDCTLNHPFPGTEFWGFDTRIIVFAGGSTTGVHDDTVRYPAPTELRMVNADGYSRWWNREEFFPTNKIFGYTDGVMAPVFTTTWSRVNGFKYYANGISSTDMPPNPEEAERGTFSSGSESRRMKLQFPQVANPFKFKYSIATGWLAPSVIPPTSVDDYGITANCAEAYQVWVTQDPASTAWYADDTDLGGNLILEIEVWDWLQGGGTVEDEISGIYIESPTLLSAYGGVIDASGWTTITGSSPNSVIYSGTINNCSPTSMELQELFITIESSDPNTYAAPLPGFSFPDSPLAAFYLYIATMKDSGIQPDKTITVTYPNGGELFVIGDTETITWDWTGAIAEVLIEYSDDAGATYPYTIATAVSNTGSYVWDPVPDNPTTQARVRITEDILFEAQDESDANFTISDTGGEPGWNPMPGQVGMVVDDPEPNQSTVQPDFGIQNDDAGAEGAWLADQEGDGTDTMMFFDYLLDWSGPGGNAYPSGFNFNFAPMGRHDVSANGVVIFGCSANTNQMAPPTVNDPLTAIWYVSYLLDDESAPGELGTVTWGDQGSTDPPEDDPDLEPWYHTADMSSGITAVNDTDGALANGLFWLMCFSHEAGAPTPDPIDAGDLNFGIWAYPYMSTSIIYRLGFPEYTTDIDPPFFEAFDVNDPTRMRLASDSDSYVTFGDPYDDTLIGSYAIDSLNRIYLTGFQLDWDAGNFGYMGLENTEKIFPGDDLHIDGGTAVDLEVLPTTSFLYDGDYEQGFNWLAILFDDGAGGWVIEVLHIDWTSEDDLASLIDITDPISGTPLSIDVDPINFTIHVLYEDGGVIKATVFDYTP